MVIERIKEEYQIKSLRLKSFYLVSNFHIARKESERILKDVNRMSIPKHSSHPFRFKSATHSDSFRPLIPI